MELIGVAKNVVFSTFVGLTKINDLKHNVYYSKFFDNFKGFVVFTDARDLPIFKFMLTMTDDRHVDTKPITLPLILGMQGKKQYGRSKYFRW